MTDKQSTVTAIDWMDRPVKDVVARSNTIEWYKEDCEICGQGAFLCRDPRCPIIRAENFYEKRRQRMIAVRKKRNILQRIAARILNEDEKTMFLYP